MKTKDEMIQMMAHDMKHPLMAILGYAQMLSMDLEEASDPKLRENANKIMVSCNDLMRMILHFLDISRMESGNFELKLSQFDFMKTVELVVGKSRMLAQKNGQDIRVAAGEKEICVEADHELIERVLTNLLSNALKYSPAGCGVEIRVAKSDQFLEFSVQDRGRGIPKEYQEKIFEKFNRVRELAGHPRSDSGLGLAFCKMAVEAHGGSIRVESESGKGSLFTFIIPLEQLKANIYSAKPLSQEAV